VSRVEILVLHLHDFFLTEETQHNQTKTKRFRTEDLPDMWLQVRVPYPVLRMKYTTNMVTVNLATS
jgi:hypothetical protein